ncbi:MAG: A24 family peptidase C-terminal domain-containing protein [Nitrosopumilaceae archaeon]
MSEFLLEFEYIRILSAVVMLGIASFYDIWKREIHDILWIGFGTLAVVLLVLDPNFSESATSILISMIVAPFAIFLWRTGMFGGADAFALIVLAALAPMVSLTDGPISPLTTISNGAMLFVFPLLVNVIRNVISILKNENIFEGFNETKSKKLLAMIIGYRAKDPNYGFAIEKTEGGKKKLSIAFHNAETTEFCTSKNTWITPGIPYILLITGGFIIQLVYGDILMNFLGIGV